MSEEVEVSWISWQRGTQEKGRSKNHLVRDDNIKKTLCGIGVPWNMVDVEVWLNGYDGITDCRLCEENAVEIKAKGWS